MSRIAVIEKDVESCWDCPHLLNAGREPVADEPNCFDIIFVCARANNRRVIDMDEFPDFCPLEECEEDDDE